MERDVYFGLVKLNGEEHGETFIAALNYVSSLVRLRCFDEVKSLLRKTIPIARRVSGDDNVSTLRLRWSYAKVLYVDPGATLDDLGAAVEIFVEIERIARHVLGGAHPYTAGIEQELRKSRAALRARESWWPFTVRAFAIVFLAWMCWKFGLGAMVFTFAVIVFVPYVIHE